MKKNGVIKKTGSKKTGSGLCFMILALLPTSERAAHRDVRRKDASIYFTI